MNTRKMITGIVLAASALSAQPVAAEAHDHDGPHRHYRGGYYEADYRRSCRTSGTTGMIVGGAAGALLGRQLDSGRDRTTGTILGAGAGALLGREVGKRSHC
jgi:uncharacterized protein YcfJ